MSLTSRGFFGLCKLGDEFSIDNWIDKIEKDSVIEIISKLVDGMSKGKSDDVVVFG